MQLSADQIIKKCAKHCGHCSRNTLLAYKYEWTCVSCNYNVIKRKYELTEIHRKRINFINRLNYAEHKIFCLCVDVSKIYESNDYDKIYEVSSTIKNKNLNINKILIENYKDTLENSEFEQYYWSRTAIGI